MTDYAMRDLTGEDKMSFSLNSHHVLDTLEDSIVVANAGGRIVYVNQALEKLLGWSARDLVGEPITILMPERFRDAHLSGFQKYLSTRRPTVIGTPMHVAARQRDGSDVDIELTLGVMSENASEPLFVATMRDLRERIELERQIAITHYLRSTARVAATVASNLDLEHVLETVVAALVKDFGAALARIWMYDAHANVLTLEASGGSIETPVSRGEQIDVATTPYKLGSVVRAREPYIRNGLENDPEFDQEWVSRERIEAVAIFPLIMADTLLGVMSLFSRAPLREEMVEALTTFNVIVSASVNDVQLFTAEQQARAQAEVTQDYFAFLADASRVLTSSLDYQITLRNVAELVVPRLADWCAVHIVEDDGSVLPLATTHVDPEKVALAEELGRRYPFDPNTASGVAEVLRTGKPEITPEITDEMLVAGATNDEILAILRDLGFTSAMIVPLLARGRTLGAITYVAAESGRHYGTADLQMAEDLARRAAIAVDNSRLYTQLEEANRARDEFISSVSHDLKNPLATLRAQTQLLQRRVSRQGGEGVQKLLPGLNQLESTTIRMEAMIGDLVDAANIRAGRPLSLLREPVDLVALSRRIAEEQQLSAPRHTIEVQSEAAEMVGQWDARRIERVLWNLLSNAVKYSPDGGTVLLEVKPKETPDGPAALLTVRDQGLGIPAADLPYIFERYRRGGNVTHHIAGTGIGLASVRHIVEQHGGSVTADSHEGRGACFTVWLPMDSSEADSA